jgi:hypothetical protein
MLVRGTEDTKDEHFFCPSADPGGIGSKPVEYTVLFIKIALSERAPLI